MAWLAFGVLYAVVYSAVGTLLYGSPLAVHVLRLPALLVLPVAGIVAIVRRRNAWTGCPWLFWATIALGLMMTATLNRTLKSFALAIVGAEYVLRWLPRGTHQWDKFVTPEELEAAIEDSGLQVTGERGVIYNPFADRWQLSSDMDVNYMLVAQRPTHKGEAA